MSLLAGCASFAPTPPSTQPQAQALDASTFAVPTNLQSRLASRPAQLNADHLDQEWWRAYDDPQLNRLMQRALQQNPTLALARSRITKAQAAAGLSEANRAPQISADVDLSFGRYSGNYQVPHPPIGKGGTYVGQARSALDFSYELDLWGKQAALIAQATAQSKAAQYDADAAILALSTSVVRSYAQLAAQNVLFELTKSLQQQRRAIRELNAQRVASGLDSRIDLLLASANEGNLSADLVQLETAQAISRLQLQALIGELPGTTSITTPKTLQINLRLPSDLPLDLLGRRPEISAQRERLHAASSEADAARAQFYPNLNLGGFIGMQSFGLGQLLAAGSFTNSIGPALRLPVFEGGRLRANYAMKQADIDSAISQYNLAILSAAQDVSEQLTRVASLDAEESAMHAALAQIQEAARLAGLRYRAGLSPALTALVIEGQLLQQKRSAAELAARRQDQQIQLIRALGGGYHDGAAKTTSTIQEKS